MRAARSRRAILAFAGSALALAAIVAFPRSARGDADITFGLAIHVARDVDASVVTDAWLADRIAEANRVFSPNGVRFRWPLALDLADSHRELHSRDDRDALASLTEPGIINLFVVARLEDVDEPGRYRMGLCWTGPEDDAPRKRYLVLAKHAHHTVLAHELGHYFGNSHSPVADNVMSYTRTGAEVFFDEAQATRVRALATRFLASGRLVDVGPPWRRVF
jgi:hypothetical protein